MEDEESITIKIFKGTKLLFQNGHTIGNHTTHMASMEEEKEEVASMEGEGRSSMAIFVDTNLDTRFVFETACDAAFGDLKEVLKSYHELCYPDMGEVGIQSLQVEANLRWYVVVDSTLVRAVFKSKSGFLKMNIICQRGHAHGTRERWTTLEPVLDSNAENRGLDHPPEADAVLQIASLEAGGSSGNLNDPAKLRKVGSKSDVDRLEPVRLGSAGEASISNALNDLAAAKEADNINYKLSENGKFGERTALSDRIFAGTDFLTQGSLMNTQDSPCSEQQGTGESGGKPKYLLQEPGSNALLEVRESAEFEVEAMAAVNSSWKIDETMDHVSRQEFQEEMGTLKEGLHLKKSSRTPPLCSEPHKTVYKCELHKEKASFTESGGQEKLSGKHSPLDKEVGLLKSDHLYVDVVPTRTDTDMGKKQLTPNGSTDRDTDELIESLLAFQNANSLCLGDKLGTCNKFTAPSKERTSLKDVVPLDGDSSEQIQEFIMPGEKPLRQKKKKKRKLLAEALEKENLFSAEERHERFQVVDDPGHTAELSCGKGENHEDLQFTDDKHKGKRVKHHHSKRSSGNEVQEDCLRSEEGRSKIHGKKKGDVMGQINSWRVTSHGDFSSDDILGELEKPKACTDLTAGELGINGAPVQGKADVDRMLKNPLKFAPASLKMKKGNKHKMVNTACQKEKPNYGLLKIGSTVRSVYLQSGALGLNNKPKRNSAINDSVDHAGKNQLKFKTEGPSNGKTRLTKKKHSEKLSKVVVSATSPEKAFNVEDNVPPIKGKSVALQSLNRKESISKTAKRAGEKRARIRLPRIRPKVPTPCPAGCGKIYSGRTSAFYFHRKKCRGLS